MSTRTLHVSVEGAEMRNESKRGLTTLSWWIQTWPPTTFHRLGLLTRHSFVHSHNVTNELRRRRRLHIRRLGRRHRDDSRGRRRTRHVLSPLRPLAAHYVDYLQRLWMMQSTSKSSQKRTGPSLMTLSTRRSRQNRSGSQ